MAQQVAKETLSRGFTNFVGTFGTATTTNLENVTLESMAASFINESVPGTLDVPIASLDMTKISGLQEAQAAVRYAKQLQGMTDRDRMLENLSNTYARIRDTVVY